MKKKIWDVLYPAVFFYMAMIAASILGMILAGKITGIYEEDASGLLNSVKGLPLLVSMGAYLFTFLMLCKTYKKDDLRFGSDRQASSFPDLFWSALFVTGAGFLWSSLIRACGLTKIFSYYETNAASAFEGQNPLLLITATVITGPAAEELVFRGMIFRRAKGNFGKRWAVAWSAILFGLYHGNMVQFIYAGGLGILLALLYDRYRSLLLVILCHMCVNLWAIFVPEVLEAAAGVGRRTESLVYLLHAAALVLSAFVLFRRNKKMQMQGNG
ncbi:MAG: CPBP family intramembrane glutamic endopeptidase [Eubacterium sp.]|nr:CPBP family intramembrane glutamic endopeptidase [Eubacterium sp.]